METEIFDKDDIEFIEACKDLVSPDLKTKKKFGCYKCGLNLSSKERLQNHMASRNCKRIRSDEDELEPHQNIGSNLQVCMDTYKTAKEKNHNDERVM